jgi:hypothetical protein
VGTPVASQVPIVAVLMMVQGALEGVLGLFLVIAGPLLFAFLRTSPSPSSGGELPPAFLSVVYVVMGLSLVALAVLRFVAAIRNLRYRGRTLGIVCLCSGALTVLSCYCTPTAAALMVYGLIVYLNEQTARAFAMAEQGIPPEEVRERLARSAAPDEPWAGGHFR